VESLTETGGSLGVGLGLWDSVPQAERLTIAANTYTLFIAFMTSLLVGEARPWVAPSEATFRSTFASGVPTAMLIAYIDVRPPQIRHDATSIFSDTMSTDRQSARSPHGSR